MQAARRLCPNLAALGVLLNTKIFLLVSKDFPVVIKDIPLVTKDIPLVAKVSFLVAKVFPAVTKVPLLLLHPFEVKGGMNEPKINQ